ncbi:MAG TPA: PaaI family thioesterase [Pyrinomonadaceae bacterium]|nr:PaaI family thioesterase [Pyrinomonadaceae bacterium]
MQPLNPAFADEVRSSFSAQSVMTLLSARLSKVEPGQIVIELPYRADLTQQHGYLHAGIVTTIADSACGYAAYTLMPPHSQVLSVEFKVNLLRPARGDLFRAQADVIKAGKTLTVVRADVTGISSHGESTLIATMLATIICLRSE